MTTAIVISYKSEDLTVSFVNDELRRCDGGDLSVVIVDNGSTEQSIGRLRSAFSGRDDIIVLGIAENVGFARANNIGADAAISNFNPENLLFTNNDIHISDARTVNVMEQKLSSLPAAGAVGPCVVGPDGRRQSPKPFQIFFKRHVEPYWDNLLMSRKAKERRLQLDYSEKAEEGWHYLVSGCFFMVKTAAWKACGGMDPHTFLYSEEAILSERLKRAGYKVWYTTEVRVLHDHGRTTGRYYDNVKVRDMKFESEVYYYREYIHTPLWQIALGRITLSLKKFFNR